MLNAAVKDFGFYYLMPGEGTDLERGYGDVRP